MASTFLGRVVASLSGSTNEQSDVPRPTQHQKCYYCQDLFAAAGVGESILCFRSRDLTGSLVASLLGLDVGLVLDWGLFRIVCCHLFSTTRACTSLFPVSCLYRVT